MNNSSSISDLHPCEIFLLAGLIIFNAIIELIDSCLLLSGLKTKQLSKSTNVSKTGTTVTTNTKANLSPSPSTTPGSSTVDQKKVVGISVAVIQSKPSASSPGSKPSESSSVSTKSTTPKSTKKRSTTSALRRATLPGTQKPVPTTNETKGFAAT